MEDNAAPETLIDEKTFKELEEIAEMIRDIRKRTGFGVVMIEFKYGEIHNMAMTINRRPPSEKKRRE